MPLAFQMESALNSLKEKLQQKVGAGALIPGWIFCPFAPSVAVCSVARFGKSHPFEGTFGSCGARGRAGPFTGTSRSFRELGVPVNRDTPLGFRRFCNAVVA